MNDQFKIKIVYTLIKMILPIFEVRDYIDSDKNNWKQCHGMDNIKNKTKRLIIIKRWN
jgi:hypothetical protein